MWVTGKEKYKSIQSDSCMYVRARACKTDRSGGGRYQDRDGGGGKETEKDDKK